MREKANLRQEQMSALTGIPIATYRRLERGETRHPSIRHLVNCAIVFQLPVEELLDDEWITWLALDARMKDGPPEHHPPLLPLAPRKVEPEWKRRPAKKLKR